MSEVAPAIRRLPFRTPTLPPATETNSYLVGWDEAVLIEPATPYAEEQDALVRRIEEAQDEGLSLRAIIATHHHVDHVGGANTLKDRLGLPLWAHPATAERLEGSITVDRLLVEGDVLSLGGETEIRLRAAHTPGHAPGHLCFFEEHSGAMIAGDMVASVGTIIVEPQDGDMTLYLASLRRMKEMEPSVLLPAHGAPVEDAAGLLDHYVAHRLAREAKVLAALEAHAGPASAADLVPVAYADAPRAVWPLAALSTEAHLIKLAADGAVIREDGRWAVA